MSQNHKFNRDTYTSRAASGESTANTSGSHYPGLINMPAHGPSAPHFYPTLSARGSAIRRGRGAPAYSLNRPARGGGYVNGATSSAEYVGNRGYRGRYQPYSTEPRLEYASGSSSQVGSRRNGFRAPKPPHPLPPVGGTLSFTPVSCACSVLPASKTQALRGGNFNELLEGPNKDYFDKPTEQEKISRWIEASRGSALAGSSDVAFYRWRVHVEEGRQVTTRIQMNQGKGKMKELFDSIANSHKRYNPIKQQWDLFGVPEDYETSTEENVYMGCDEALCSGGGDPYESDEDYL
ncbi:hypothetical protein CYLTODRAFT_495202 [Cylindrobasidium torrendii FP15055 ss-10]|uniref:Uncharacterized protein n=1 Tax=Cylindrobasidium torrendii FP15055 ss-10 TaxID=1314674 RepID=A0A0D7AT41_9AGAR|nr:hypothetical protein CYLTODRAFT_495202 [Cylindrobasidium torrendii FP15055 ss-10]